MDITSPRLLKIKGGLFLVLGLLAAFLLLSPDFSWRELVLFTISVWAFGRAYYFCFYVLEHYADPTFRYAGLLDLCGYLLKRKRPKASR